MPASHALRLHFAHRGRDKREVAQVVAELGSVGADVALPGPEGGCVDYFGQVAGFGGGVGGGRPGYAYCVVVVVGVLRGFVVGWLGAVFGGLCTVVFCLCVVVVFLCLVAILYLGFLMGLKCFACFI